MEHDEAEDEDDVLRRQQPFEEDSTEREIALVALEAAALSRRIFPAQEGTGRVTRAGRQVLLALALVDQEFGLTRPQLSHALALDGEHTREALAELLAFGLVEHTEPWFDEEEEEEVVDDDPDEAYSLTAGGATAARELARGVREFLPGWPPSRAEPRRPPAPRPLRPPPA